MEKNEIVIQPGKKISHYWKELWAYRELFLFLSWKDILIRYKQAALGISWSIVRPFLTMVVFTIVFGKVAKLPSDTGVPYPIMVFAAMLPWQFFATSLQEGSNSLINNSSLISKVYFPRIIIPVSTIVVSLIDFLISFLLLIGLMVWFKYLPSINILTIPLFLIVAILPSLGAGLWIASLNVRYRDFKFIVPFIVQFGLYISPVGFSSSVVPEKLRLLYSINPMVGVIDGFRWAITGNNAGIFVPGLYMSITLSFLLLLSGFWYFRKTERTFADII